LQELVIACGDASELLEFGEHALDQIALFVEAPITGLRIRWSALRTRRDDGDGSHGLDGFVEVVCVVRLVGNDVARPQAVQQRFAEQHIAALTGTEDEAHRQAQRIANGMDLGA